jgi:hypothetical protein
LIELTPEHTDEIVRFLKRRDPLYPLICRASAGFFWLELFSFDLEFLQAPHSKSMGEKDVIFFDTAKLLEAFETCKNYRLFLQLNNNVLYIYDGDVDTEYAVVGTLDTIVDQQHDESIFEEGPGWLCDEETIKQYLEDAK